MTGKTIQTRRGLDLARLLTVPPISVDELDTLTDGCFGNWVRQKTEQGMRPDSAQFSDAAGIIDGRLDRVRAPWLEAGRRPTPRERAAYIEWVAGSGRTGECSLSGVRTRRSRKRS